MTRHGRHDVIYNVVMKKPVRELLAEELDEAESNSLLMFMMGPLKHDPYGQGRRLQMPFSHLLMGAHDGFRITYEVDDIERTVVVVAVTPL